MQVSTHFSNFVFDMMSSFQLTKISPISPSVRQPESAIGFWKTCSQKIRKVSNSSETKAAQPLVQLSSDFAFFECSVSNFLEAKSNSLWALVTAVTIFPKHVTSFWHRHCHLQSRGKHWDLQADCSAEEHSHDFRVNCYTNYTYASHLSPYPEHSESTCVQSSNFSGALGTRPLESRIPV